MKYYAAYFLSIIILICPSLNHARDRAFNMLKIFDKEGSSIELPYKESHALIIGVSNYEHWPELKGVKDDIKAVKFALEMNGFQTKVIENPDSDKLKKEILDFIFGYGAKKENRLLFYLAGHGKTLTLEFNNQIGCFVPADAPVPDKNNLSDFMRKVVYMKWFKLYAECIQAKHALFIFDSCFSGSIFEFRGESDYKGISKKIANPVRQFIASGKADEKVPDKSIFREQFIIALNGSADSDDDGFITGTELGLYLQKEVKKLSGNTQTPQYAKILNKNLNKGDFVFKVTDNAESKINILSVWKNVQNQLNKIKKRKKINCKHLEKFINNFENKQRTSLNEAVKTNEESGKVKEIFEIIEKLTDKLNKCKWGIGCQCH